MTNSLPATALLVIDVQRAAFDGVRCPPMDAPERLLASTHALLAAAREGQRAIVFVQHGEGAGEPFEHGTPHWQLHESLVPRDGESRLDKRESSSFAGTGLHERLQALQVGTLVLCGLQSEHCVSNTARSAIELGYRVRVAQDGHGTWPWDGRTAAEIRDDVNRRLAAAGAEVEPTAALAEALRRPA